MLLTTYYWQKTPVASPPRQPSPPPIIRKRSAPASGLALSGEEEKRKRGRATSSPSGGRGKKLDPVYNFSKWVFENVEVTGMDIPCAPSVLIEALSSIMERSPGSVFLDRTSMFGYLSTMLGFRCPNSKFYSTCNITEKNTGLYQSAGYYRHRIARSTTPMVVADKIPSKNVLECLEKHNVRGVTHMFANISMGYIDELIEMLLRSFHNFSTLTTMFIFSKENTMINIVKRYPLTTITPFSYTRGVNGGNFKLYTLHRDDYLVITPPPQPKEVEVPSPSSSSSSSSSPMTVLDDDDDDYDVFNC